MLLRDLCLLYEVWGMFEVRVFCGLGWYGWGGLYLGY